MITSLAVGNKLHDKNRNRAQQQDMDKAALVQKELKDKPKDEKYSANRPHLDSP